MIITAKKLTLLIIATVSLIIAVAGLLSYWFLNKPAFFGNKPIVVQIDPGTGFRQLASQLQQREIVSSARLLTLYAVLTSQARQIKAGEYQLESGISALQLLDLLTSGRVISYQLTLVEGWGFNEMMTELSKQEKLKHLLRGLSASEVMAALGRAGEHPEGRFFPDSYQYVAGHRDIDILQRAYQRSEQILAEEWLQRMANLPYETSYEALVMASIVEKETGSPDERNRIAGVFVRRLQKGMRLQTDPTVIYGLGETYKGNLTRKHLSTPNPYNTYVIRGLPPTPIALVGRAAIRAALHPEPGNSLYFVAKGDGTHFFSDTLAQHNRAVRRFQVRHRPKNYQSAPKQNNR